MAMSLVDDTGFDPYDAGTLAESWRQQPNSPAYCTELTLDELPAAWPRPTASRTRPSATASRNASPPFRPIPPSTMSSR